MTYYCKGIPQESRTIFEGVIQSIISAHWKAYQRLISLCPDGERIDLPPLCWYISRFGSAILIEDSSGWWMVLDSPEERPEVPRSEGQIAFRVYGQADTVEDPPEGISPTFWKSAHTSCGLWKCDVFFDVGQHGGNPEWFSYTYHKLDIYHNFLYLFQRMEERLEEMRVLCPRRADVHKEGEE